MTNVHVIIGEDDFLIAETAKKIIGNGEGLEVIDANTASNADLQLASLREANASFSTPPFLEPRKVTWWKNVRFLPQNGKGAPSEEVKKALENFATQMARVSLGENQHFILSGPRLLMTSIFAKTIKAKVEMIVFEAAKPWEQSRLALGRAVDFAAELGITFAPGAAEQFVARVGCDTRSIHSEVQKLRDYLGPKNTTASVADVNEIASTGIGVEPAVWTITDALGVRKVAAVLDAAHPFEKESGFAVLVTSVVEKFFRQLTELKDAQSRGRIVKAGGDLTPYALKKMMGYLNNWSLRELRLARYRFMALREKSVSSAGTIDALVVMELVRACRKI